MIYLVVVSLPQVIPNVALTSADLKEGDNTFTSVAGTPIVVRNA
jgi:hypothetical protein